MHEGFAVKRPAPISVPEFAIDSGGTFTDCIGTNLPGNLPRRVVKVLSNAEIPCAVTARTDAKGCKARVFGWPNDLDLPENFFAAWTFEAEGGKQSSRNVLTCLSSSGNRGKDTEDHSVQLRFREDISLDGGTRLRAQSPWRAPTLAIRMLLGLAPHVSVPPVRLRIGTTIATNALLEGRGAKTALVTTSGFRDVLSIGTQQRPRLFELNIHKPEPLAKISAEVDERIDARGRIIRTLDKDGARKAFENLRRDGVTAVAIALVNAWRNPTHETALARIAAEVGFDQIVVSTARAMVQKLLPRASAAVLDARLGREVGDFFARLAGELPDAGIEIMTSAGDLAGSVAAFRPRDGIISGPAGGAAAVGRIMADIAQSSGRKAKKFPSGAIGFDMGGTSTDVCRVGPQGRVSLRLETMIQDQDGRDSVELMMPMLAVETIAAGGGSICGFDGLALTVGPASAGSSPGPACYGRGGPLTLTDLNVLLGRVHEADFPFPLDRAAARSRLAELAARLGRSSNETRFNGKDGSSQDELELAEQLVRIADLRMAQAIARNAGSEGVDPRHALLVPFGGAAGQHAASVARILGMARILVHPDASVLSASGIGSARQTFRMAAEMTARLDKPGLTRARRDAEKLVRRALRDLRDSGQAKVIRPAPRIDVTIDLRYLGQDMRIPLAVATSRRGRETLHWRLSAGALRREFLARHEERFGFVLPKAATIEMRTIRCEISPATPRTSKVRSAATPARRNHPPAGVSQTGVFHAGAWHDAPVIFAHDLMKKGRLVGPALIRASGTTLFVPPGFRVEAAMRGEDSTTPFIWIDTQSAQKNRTAKPGKTTPRVVTASAPGIAEDPAQLAVDAATFTHIAASMGGILQRSSLSVNIRERLDFSCAVFDRAGQLVVNAPHIPVHLGAMGETVRAVREAFPVMRAGETFVTNDPYRGGSHLPDVTLVTPVFFGTSRTPDAFVASRAHHSEIGGTQPGSMPPFSKTLDDEGVIIPPTRLRPSREADWKTLRDLLISATWPSRNPDGNLADLRAQIAAGELGRKMLTALAEESTPRAVKSAMQRLCAAAEHALATHLSTTPEFSRSHADHVIPGLEVQCKVHLTHRPTPRLTIDFTGTGPQHSGNLNANPAIVRAAVLYALRCWINREIPLNDGILSGVDIRIPPGSFLDPRTTGHRPPAVVGGNVETSQRLCDILLNCLGLAAGSQGTMNNFLFGTSRGGYYETICGGSGATPTHAGADAVHTHMTNTRITDVEVLEERFPVRVNEFSIRRGSGGRGTYAGGDGTVREIEFLKPMQVSILSTRRSEGPNGLRGGARGLPGLNLLLRNDQTTELDAGAQLAVKAHDRIRIETPGGGAAG